MVRVAETAAAMLLVLGAARAEKQLKIMGQSGKFTLYEATPDDGITVTMDALSELDAAGNEVGSGGAVKHSFNSFATQSFTIAEKESGVAIGTATADRVNFTANIGSETDPVGKLKVETYLITENGTVGNGDESWEVVEGDLKWNIVFPQWKFCNPCTKGGTQETGNSLDLTITVSGQGAASDKGSGKVSIGGGKTLNLASKVSIDGTNVDMPEGYPKTTVQGSKTMTTFRFPKFSESVVYDPTIGSEGGSGTDNAPSDDTALSDDTPRMFPGILSLAALSVSALAHAALRA